MEVFRVPVRQLSGKVVVLEATPTTTVREFKNRLEGWHPSEDELTRKMSTVDLIVGGEKVLENYKRLELRLETVNVLILCCDRVGSISFFMVLL